MKINDLLVQLQHQSHEQRLEAIRKLTSGSETTHAYFDLLLCLNDPHSLIRDEILRWLEHSPPPSLSTLTEALHHENEHVREYALWFIGCMGARAHTIDNVLLNAFIDNHDCLCEHAAWALSNVCASSPQSSAAFVNLLNNDNAKIRSYAAWALGSFSSPGLQIISSLTSALCDSSPLVVGYAAVTLGKHAHYAQVAVPDLLQIARQYPGDVGECALWALAQIKATRLKDLVDALDGHERLQQFALWQLGEMGATALPALPAVLEIFAQEETEVRKYLLWAVKRIIDRVPQQNLLRIVKDLPAHHPANIHLAQLSRNIRRQNIVDMWAQVPQWLAQIRDDSTVNKDKAIASLRWLTMTKMDNEASHLRREVERITHKLLFTFDTPGALATQTPQTLLSFIRKNVRAPRTQKQAEQISTAEIRDLKFIIPSKFRRPVCEKPQIEIWRERETLRFRKMSNKLSHQFYRQILTDGSPCFVIQFSGNIDSSTVLSFGDVLEAILDNFFSAQIKCFVIVFSELKEINSTGLGVLVKLIDKYHAKGAQIKIGRVPQKLRVLFDMLGLNMLLQLYADEIEAIKALEEEIAKRQIDISPAAPLQPPAPPPPPKKARPTEIDKTVIADISIDEFMEAEPAEFADIDIQELPEEEVTDGILPVELDDDEIAVGEEEIAVGEMEPLQEIDFKEKEVPVELSEIYPELDAEFYVSDELDGEAFGGAQAEDGFLVGGPRDEHPIDTEELETISRGKRGLRTDTEIVAERDQEVLEKSKRKLQPPERVRKIPEFEKMLGEEAGNPGPLERLVAQSTLFMKTIQVTIGLKFILVANACDIFVQGVTGYVQGIFRAWKMMRTLKRRMHRHLAGTQAQEMAEDLQKMRVLLSRLFTFAGFSIEQVPEQQQELATPSFAVKLALETRGYLDEMKRDLSLLTAQQAVGMVKKSIGDFLLSLIPNPLEIFSGWKDIFILAFMMKYSRHEIEEMYIDAVLCQQKIIHLLQNTTPDVPIDTTLVTYEQKILQRVGEGVQIAELENLIAASRINLQRLLQLLSNPGQFIDPRKWDRVDVLRELKNMEIINFWHPQFVLEWERWLTSQVAIALRQKGIRPNLQEIQLRQQEMHDFLRRYQLQKKLAKQFL